MILREQTFNDREAARFLGLGVQTLRNFRHLMKGPRYIKLGRRVVYRLADLQEYLNRNVIDPEARRGGR